MSLEHHMEHAAHAGEGGHGHDDGGHGGGHGGTLGRDVGIVMAGLGMLLAFCSALVGAERTDLIAAMVAQTNTSGTYSALAAKHRVIQAQLQQLHARMPAAADDAKTDGELAKVGGEVKDPAALTAVKAISLQSHNVLETVVPSQVDLDRFAWLVMKFGDQREAAKEWTEAYEPAVEAHREAAERYEYGQLAAELGIVLASIAMLFKSRKVFWVSALLGIAGLAIVIHTYVETTTHLNDAEKKTTAAQRRFVSLSSEAADAKADEELVKEIEEAR